ncbi:MAG: SDR family oxidoreductase [Planctomycetia bacterium]|nr:SDR family oxidoreductase [Planctomycetia bacterium]
MGKLDGKVALVTGASQGIGKAIAMALAAEGAKLVITARRIEALERVADELRPPTPTLPRKGGGGTSQVLPVAADVTDERQVETLFARTMETFGRLDLLVNNAGAFDGGPIEDLSAATWDKVLAVNLRAPFLCTRAAFRIMKPQRSGRIINIGSISAQRPRLNSAPYTASKFGLWGLTQSTALEGRAFGITCGCLHPGNVAVERRNSDKPEDAEPMMTPAEIAEVAVLMAALPPHVEMLEAIVLPREQLYVGRG